MQDFLTSPAAERQKALEAAVPVLGPSAVGIE